MPHGHCSPQGQGQGAAACPHFTHGTCTGQCSHYPAASQAPTGAPSWGHGLDWLLGTDAPVLDSAIPAPAPFQRFHREVEFIVLARSVTSSSGHSASSESSRHCSNPTGAAVSQGGL